MNGSRSDILTAAGLVGSSSPAFIDRAFEFYSAGQPFLILPSTKTPEIPSQLQLGDIYDPEIGSGWYCNRQDPIRSKDLAQISLTSGTTGKPKAILLSHAALADTTDRLIAVQQLDATVREYVGVPLGFSFGFGRVRACMAIGGQIYIPARGFDPAEIASMLAARQINSLSAVPTLLRILLQRPDLFSTAGANLRWMEIGSQPMAATEKRQIRDLFPNARIIQHYGLTEAARTCFLDVSACPEEALSSVGTPVGDTRIRISADGRIQIAGSHVALECITSMGRLPLVDAEGWLTTSDNGRIEGEHLYFEGRADDLINIGGMKLQPDRVEELIRSYQPQLPRIAVCRITDPLRGDGILVATDDRDLPIEPLKEMASQALASLGVSAGGALHVHRFDALPLTDTNKLQRHALTEMFAAVTDSAKRSSPALAGGTFPASGEDDNLTLRIFEGAFTKMIDRGKSFADLGGDSLALVSILSHEEMLGGLPEGWEHMPVDDLERRRLSAQNIGRPSQWLSRISSEIVLRALAITSIVFHHALDIDLGGGIQVLLLLLGFNLARFQRARLTGAQKWSLLFEMILKLVIPYYVIIAALDLRHDAWVSLPDYLLVSNFVGRDHVPTVPYWFILGYIQILILLLLIASNRRVAHILLDRPSWFGVCLFSTAILSKIAALTIFHHQALRDRTPDQFLYIVALGWCLQTVRTPLAKLALAATAALIAALDMSGPLHAWSSFDGRFQGPALLFAVIVILYVPKIKLPVRVSWIFAEISLASLMIYLYHPVIIYFLGPYLQPAIIAPLALAGGVIIARSTQWIKRSASSKLQTPLPASI